MKTGARCMIPRCGCCDRAYPAFLCEACGEPTCASCIRREGPEGTPSYCCQVCVEARDPAGILQATDAA